jgi:predicted flap endonuclease-1-like 5' DNA nuclease
MFYLISEIVLCLLIALLLGVIIGWLIHRLLAGGKAGNEVYDSRIALLEKHANNCEKNTSVLENRFLTIEKQMQTVEKHTNAIGARTEDNKAQNRLSVKNTHIDYSGTEKDDLKRIHGIGPVLERLLNSHKVTRFDQIALWSDSDIAHFSSLLGPFRDRIKRDYWIESAKALANSSDR